MKTPLDGVHTTSEAKAKDWQSKAKTKDLEPKAKAKDMVTGLEDPRGQLPCPRGLHLWSDVTFRFVYITPIEQKISRASVST